MHEEEQVGLWHVSIDPDAASPVVRDRGDNPVATIHAVSEEAILTRAALVASAPALLDAVIGSLDVFRVMAEHAPEPANLAAQDMIPILESALGAAQLFGPIEDVELSMP